MSLSFPRIDMIELDTCFEYLVNISKMKCFFQSFNCQNILLYEKFDKGIVNQENSMINRTYVIHCSKNTFVSYGSLDPINHQHGIFEFWSIQNTKKKENKSLFFY